VIPTSYVPDFDVCWPDAKRASNQMLRLLWSESTMNASLFSVFIICGIVS
jgi:hypothetical protein